MTSKISSDASFGLPPSRRFHNSYQFKQVFKHGRFVKRNGLCIRWKENDEQHSRLGVVLTRRVGSAVTRNKLRRQIREFFRLNINPDVHFDFVFIPYSKSMASSTDKLKNQAFELIEKIQTQQSTQQEVSLFRSR